jgi:hypothetical protein
MAGIRQHILPRFLLKGFASRTQDKKIFTCVYRKGGPQFETTIENVGLEKHFYGKVGEISADEEITQLESGYARFIDELRNEPDGARVDSKYVSDFVAHLTVRTKQLREFFRESAEYLIDNITIYLANPSNLKKLMVSKPELMRQELQNTLKEIPVDQAYKDFLIELVQLNAQEIIDQHMPDLQSTLNELIAQIRSLLPNAVREGHIKTLAKHPAPEPRSEGYQSLNWFVRELAEPLILGDIGCLFEIAGERRFKPFDDKGDKILNVYSPIASRKLLLGTSYSAAFDVNISHVNQATSKCSYEYFVCSELSTANEGLSHSLGDWAGILSKREMEQLLNEILADLDQDQQVQGATRGPA